MLQRLRPQYVVHVPEQVIVEDSGRTFPIHANVNVNVIVIREEFNEMEEEGGLTLHFSASVYSWILARLARSFSGSSSVRFMFLENDSADLTSRSS